MTTPQLFDEYDIIFAGGGTAAGVVVGRLAAADPSLRILILEIGPTVRDNLAHIQPGRFLTHLLPESQTVKHVIGKPSEHLNGRQLPIQCGQCVGGGSSVNFMKYTRAPASDYDDWAHLYNNPGWSFHELLPFIKKVETYQNVPNRPTHGYDGPLKVSYGGALTSVGTDFVETVLRYDRTRTAVDDANSMVQDVNRIEPWPKWIDGKTGRRSDVAHHYIYPALDKSKKVHLLPGCAVKRVVIEEGKATGVEFLHNTLLSSDADTTPRIVRASKLVVISAGTFGSPGILERSGIGSKDILDRNSIKQVVDLPGVGENYNDHPLIFVPFHAKKDADTLDGIVRGDADELEKWSAQWQQNGQGLMATNGLDGGYKFRPSEKELRTIGPEFAERWASYYASTPDRPIMWAGQISQYVGLSPPAATHKAFCTGVYSTHPVGTGSVHITSAHDVHSPVDFDTGVLSRKEDLAVMRYAWKLAREYGRRMSSYRGEYAPDHPTFPQDSEAAVSQDHNTPVAIDAPDIVYTKEDDEAIDDFLKARIITAWHSLGTCAMKPRDQFGVVDSRLNVYGVQNLKVADMSICPSNVATNTYSTAVMIGEKAAAIIAEDLGFAEV
ncbi:alcohol oxidase-like protein [Dichomitus squalens]|uniref:Alcohol oxidase-like protein n=1 Tax=Dichomitus squalens TaxID=114155 RepID=A0A4Q9NAP3_9APHY|nr:alcohol oxidase-like protein [Dichomitus squalens]TBU52612.1 alcohol oxidase-like protein [Dichomitus squalens]